jgi:outer membrane protein assembly factor BamE
MRLSSCRPDRTPAFVGTILLVLAACLAGCASKNPLMEEPAGSAAANPQPSTAPSGMQTTAPSGAQRVFGIFSPYRIDIQQGNFVSEEMIAQLKEGLSRPEGVTREQVRFVLGTPLLTDIFHADRWDYAFRLKKGNGEVISSHVAVFFDNNRLARIDGGALPNEKAYLDLIAGRVKQ